MKDEDGGEEESEDGPEQSNEPDKIDEDLHIAEISGLLLLLIWWFVLLVNWDINLFEMKLLINCKCSTF